MSVAAKTVLQYWSQTDPEKIDSVNRGQIVKDALTLARAGKTFTDDHNKLDRFMVDHDKLDHFIDDHDKQDHFTDDNHQLDRFLPRRFSIMRGGQPLSSVICLQPDSTWCPKSFPKFWVLFTIVVCS